MALERYGVALLASTLKYKDGKIGFFLIIVNQSMSDLVVHFDTTEEFDFALYDSDGNEYWRWSKGQSFQPTAHDLIAKAQGFYVLNVQLDKLPPPPKTPATISLEGKLFSTTLPFKGELKLSVVSAG
jgi:Intracellular proteinase inhibitor